MYMVINKMMKAMERLRINIRSSKGAGKGMMMKKMISTTKADMVFCNIFTPSPFSFLQTVNHGQNLRNGLIKGLGYLLIQIDTLI